MKEKHSRCTTSLHQRLRLILIGLTLLGTVSAAKPNVR